MEDASEYLPKTEVRDTVRLQPSGRDVAMLTNAHAVPWPVPDNGANVLEHKAVNGASEDR